MGNFCFQINLGRCPDLPRYPDNKAASDTFSPPRTAHPTHTPHTRPTPHTPHPQTHPKHAPPHTPQHRSNWETRPWIECTYIIKVHTAKKHCFAHFALIPHRRLMVFSDVPVLPFLIALSRLNDLSSHLIGSPDSGQSPGLAKRYLSQSRDFFCPNSNTNSWL